MAKADDKALVAPPHGSDEHRKCLEHVLQRVRAAQAAHDLLVPEWIENYKAFRALPGRNYPTGKAPWQTDYRPPYVAEQVNTLLPRLVEGNPRSQVLPGAPETSWEAARAQEQYLNFSLHQDEYALKSARWALTTLLFGSGWSKQGFLSQNVMRDFVVNGKHERRMLSIANRGTQTIGHPFDVMGDPNAPTLETSRYVVWRTMSTVGQVHANRRRRVRTREGVERWTGRYDNVGEVGPFGAAIREYQLPNDLTGQIPEHVNVRTKGQAVELLEVFDRETDRVYTIANRQVVLRDQPMPWWHGQLPVALAITMPDIGTMLGISKVDDMRGMQENLWLREQQVIDNARLQTDFVLLIRDTVMNMDAYQLGPGAKWPVENMDDVQALQYPQPQLASQADLEMVRGRLQSFAGTGYMNGAGSGQSGFDQNTASGLIAIIEENNRGTDFAFTMMRYAHERAQMQMLSDAAQFLEDEVFVPGASRGKDPIMVNPDLLAAKTWVRVTLGSETGMKSLKQQMSTTLLQAIAQIPPETPIPTPAGLKQLSYLPVIEALADSYDRDAEDFLTDMQQAQAMTAPTDPAAMMLAAMEQGANPGMVVPQLPANAPVGALA